MGPSLRSTRPPWAVNTILCPSVCGRSPLVRHNPWFYYNPKLFWNANPDDARAKIPPGPNNPVGVVWMGLTKPHYGIHGTPSPSKIGHAESHGCIRLTNWDALELSGMVHKGMPVNLTE
jgi:lipoprotein-anchoring transpeptidase ErfK/SrfK